MDTPYFGTSTVKGKIYNYFSFTTKSMAMWNSQHVLWYPSGIKVIPNNIAEILTPISLAYWLMDDGGWVKKGIHLNTNGFTTSDVERLCIVMKDKYNLKCTVQSRNRLYIWVESVPHFIEIVRPHVHSSMIDKITP